jgi:hypothetical protein
MQPARKPASQPPPDSQFAKFQAFMKKLVQVPKAELDEKLEEETRLKPKNKPHRPA